MSITGSFASGDFHLSRRSPLSFSDVDLVCPGILDGQRKPIGRQLTEQVANATSIEIPFNIHPYDTLSELSSEDAIVLSVCETLRARPKMLRNPAYRHYRVAKLARLLNGIDLLPLSQQEKRHIVDVKRGWLETSSIEINLIDRFCEIDHPLSHLYRSGFGASVSIDELELAVQSLNASAVHPWLISVMATHLAGLENR